MLKRIFFISVLLGLLVFSGCGTSDSNTNGETSNTTMLSPQVSIMAGDIDITPIVKSNVLSMKEDVNNTKLFQSIVSDKKINIPYVKLGETVQIKFKNNIINTCKLEDYILKEDGTLKYKKESIKTTDINFSNGVGIFILNENLFANFSSDSKDYESGKIIRGFKLISDSIDNKQREYVFIVKTDAMNTDSK